MVKKEVLSIAVTSGKGGVGKTNIVSALAMSLQKNYKKRVLVLDADLGLGNIDILLNLTPKFNIRDVLENTKKLNDIIVDGPSGIKIIPASSGFQELTRLDEFQRMKILQEFENLEKSFDILIIDTGAGISDNVGFFCVASHEIIVVTTPEPTAMTDSYAVIKVLHNKYQEKKFNILVNFVKDEKEAIEVYKRLSLVADRFLNVSLDYLGCIEKNDNIVKAVRQQKSFWELFPDSQQALSINEIAKKLVNIKPEIKSNIQFF